MSVTDRCAHLTAPIVVPVTRKETSGAVDEPVDGRLDQACTPS